jgi:hypothetical protein
MVRSDEERWRDVEMAEKRIFVRDKDGEISDRAFLVQRNQ